MEKIRVGIVGIGNCASSFVQLISAPHGSTEGIAHSTIGGYSRRDILISCAFDINASKVGKDISIACFAEPNNTTKYFEIPRIGVEVSPGVVEDGISVDVQALIPTIAANVESSVAEIAKVLRDTRTEIALLYLPVGSPLATQVYVAAALLAQCAVVNCTPESVAGSEKWAAAFTKAGRPLLGDDIKSQIGATTIHRAILQKLNERGAVVEKTYQINVGGNTDFLNMTDRRRSASKKLSKTAAISALSTDHSPSINVGPSDYLPVLADRKVAYIRIEGSACMGMKFSLEARLDVEDSPNSAGVVVDAVRCARIAIDRGIAGPLDKPSALLFKAPPLQMNERAQLDAFEEFIR